MRMRSRKFDAHRWLAKTPPAGSSVAEANVTDLEQIVVCKRYDVGHDFRSRSTAFYAGWLPVSVFVRSTAIRAATTT
jgi:hypothetical protein